MTDVSVRPKSTLDEVPGLAAQYNNWGKWGSDNQLGTLRQRGSRRRHRHLGHGGPTQRLDEPFHPLHVVLLVNAGLVVGEIFDFEKLAADCAADGAYEFMFAAGPPHFTKAVGSPLHPMGIK